MNTHAQKVNNLYEVAESNFVTSTKIRKASKAFFRSQLEAVVDEFRRRNCNPQLREDGQNST